MAPVKRTPSASILFPTRGRPGYLAVALASVAAQARAAGAEIVVVEDDASSVEVASIAAAHGARHLAHGAPRGINVARNTAIEAAAGDLLCLLDDDVAAWPGWLAALLLAAAACPGHEALGGPIRARLEGTDLHACGREPLPVTTLDLGAQDRDTPLLWGANLTLRRAAVERVGAFDPALGGAGDEEEWLRRLGAAGGRARYVAGAGVDHRRAGADARLRRLARAEYRRGRAARSWDVRKGAAPPPREELVALAGAVWHTGRRRCGNGIVMAAHDLGRLREWAAPARHAPAAGPDYLSGESGTLGRRDLATARVRDLLARPPRVRPGPPRRVLALCVARPGHEREVSRLRAALARSRHEVSLVLVAPTAGKWANLNTALAEHPAAGHDWLLLLDDDVVLPRRFLDRFLAVAESCDFALAQPAHAFASHAAWRVTRRVPGVLARRTRFVEIGPVTAVRADAFATFLPFPDLQMGWGLDAHWGALAAARGWRVGVVDATPIRHLRPVASAYPREAAVAEADLFLATRPYVARAQAQETLATYR